MKDSTVLMLAAGAAAIALWPRGDRADARGSAQGGSNPLSVVFAPSSGGESSGLVGGLLDTVNSLLGGLGAAGDGGNPPDGGDGGLLDRMKDLLDGFDLGGGDGLDLPDLPDLPNPFDLIPDAIDLNPFPDEFNIDLPDLPDVNINLPDAPDLTVDGVPITGGTIRHGALDVLDVLLPGGNLSPLDVLRSLFDPDYPIELQGSEFTEYVEGEGGYEVLERNFDAQVEALPPLQQAMIAAGGNVGIDPELYDTAGGASNEQFLELIGYDPDYASDQTSQAVPSSPVGMPGLPGYVSRGMS